ncbi:MAG: Histidine phosphatase family protein [Chloroflexi bacterium]|jgi:broad specificity phosphatase PhoE|nr:Histidine phosphatase family protein [Chloroflexota bacterium]
MLDQQKWPDHIYIVRHGESAGNVAHYLAHQQNKPFIEIDAARDMDVPLSALGHRQAEAVGRWFGSLPPQEQPTTILSSSYLRAKDTARGLAEAAGWDLDTIQLTTDERLREREFGILDRLTTMGIEQKYPDQAVMRRSLGKFYYRPPGGESWCDVILRLRSVIDTITREYRGERVLIVCHTVVVLCFRYLLERLDEEQVLAIDRKQEVANCSVTSYCFDQALGKNGKLKLNLFNFVAPLEAAGEPVTREPDAPVAPK